MFGFGKKKKVEEKAKAPKGTENESTNKKKKSRTDKLVMGAIVGVAVGSVVGISLQGKNEHEQKEEGAKKLSFNQPEAPQESSNGAEPKSRFGRFLKRIFSKKKSKKPVHNGQTFKKIPNEWE